VLHRALDRVGVIVGVFLGVIVFRTLRRRTETASRA
jgi:uncharacterized membrane-anchored protein YhcB (DUF1043 family)